jgi:hypothetical protein
MQAFAEVLEDNWEEEWNIIAPEFKYHEDGKEGQLKAETHKAEGLALKLTHLLYVDDGAFAFESREDLIKGSNMIFKLFRRFGLLMHIGRGETESKTKAMFFPKRMTDDNKKRKKKEKETTNTNQEEYNNNTDNNNDNNNTETTNGTDENEEEKRLPLPPPFDVADGFVSFTDSFTYLGSIVTPDLRDDEDIRARIKKAAGQVGGLRPFFRSPHIDLETKVRVYLAIPLNTVLWGCESWALTEDLIRELRVFHHRSLRKILNINMFEVEEQRITNTTIRERTNVPDILILAQRRQLRWIGKLARMPMKRLPRQLLAAWVNNPRKRGRPQTSLRNTMIETLQEALDDQVSKDAPLEEWIDSAKDQRLWENIIETWYETAHERSMIESL